MAYQNLVGQTFGEWIVVGDPHETTSDRDRYWNCICSCGTERKVRGSSLRKGKSLSCGCLKKKLMSERFTKNLIGQVFGKLTVIEEMPHVNGNAMWKCKCECGNECIRSTKVLTKPGIHSCGCYNKEQITNLNKKDLIGQRFGKLTVIEETPQRKFENIIWKCQCDCGNICYIPTNSLTTGNTSSCGCIISSIGEKNIEKILKENNILYIKQYTNSELKLKRYDFAIQNSNNQIIRLIEFDGQQHYTDNSGIWNSPESLKQIQERDKMKNQYALEHNIPLVRIPYWKRDNITLDMILGNQYLVTK